MSRKPDKKKPYKKKKRNNSEPSYTDQVYAKYGIYVEKVTPEQRQFHIGLIVGIALFLLLISFVVMAWLGAMNAGNGDSSDESATSATTVVSTETDNVDVWSFLV